MNYIEITVKSYKKYLLYIKSEIQTRINQTIENEILLKPIHLLLKIINKINKITNKIEKDMNDMYSSIRKYRLHLKDYLKGSIFFQQSNMNEFKKAANRTVLYIQCCFEKYLLKKDGDDYYEYNVTYYDIDNKQAFNDNFTLNIYLTDYMNSPFTEEYIMFNIILHEDNIFFYRMKDSLYKFFYFYKTDDNEWYWSPPRKTDLEDVWMKCPKYLVESGYWMGMQIPKFIEEFVIWLDLLKPDLPYIERVDDGN